MSVKYLYERQLIYLRFDDQAPVLLQVVFSGDATAEELGCELFL